jgi:hypothetical protein
MSSAGCGFWFDLDIFFGGSGSAFFTGGGSIFFSCGFGRLMFPRSSSNRALRSVEKGVFNSRKGLLSKCLEI